MKTHLLVTAGTLLLISNLAFADDDEDENGKGRRHRGHDDDFSWSYLELSDLGYSMDLGALDIEPDGYRLGLSLELGHSLYGIVNRTRTDANYLGSNRDFDTQGYGFGFHGDSWFASYTYNTWEFSNNDFDVDALRVGFRDNWTRQLEFNASYSWNNIENADTEDGYQFGLAYEIWDDFNLTVDYQRIGGQLDLSSMAFGIRYDF